MHQEGWVVVFGKPPVAGRAKTRLGATIGHDRAARVAEALLTDTVRMVRRAAPRGTCLALATTDPEAQHGRATSAVDAIWDQGGGDLGSRVERMLRRALTDAPWAVALGADAPHLPEGHLGEAARALRTHDAVLGPSDDGGFWGLGLRACEHGLLADLPWSQPTTGAATLARLRERGRSVAELPPWWDVDDEPTLRRLLAHGGAPETVAVVRAWGGDVPTSPSR